MESKHPAGKFGGVKAGSQRNRNQLGCSPEDQGGDPAEGDQVGEGDGALSVVMLCENVFGEKGESYSCQCQ